MEEATGLHFATRMKKALERGVVLINVPFDSSIRHLGRLNVDNFSYKVRVSELSDFNFDQ